MFDTVILLAGPTERPVLAAALQGHRADLCCLEAPSLEALLGIGGDVLARGRLVAFASPVIVPAAILDRLGFGAVNFHPGPPDYPGYSPAQFAIYDGARRFGATAHVMLERVDEGPIFDVGLFDVPPETTTLALEIKAYQELARLFWRNAGRLATAPDLPAAIGVAWSVGKSTKAKYRALCAVPPDIGAEELRRRLLAFGNDSLGIGLTVTLHGVTFAYRPEGPA